MAFLHIHPEMNAVFHHFHPVGNGAVQQAGLLGQPFQLPHGNVVALINTGGVDFLRQRVHDVLLELLHAEAQHLQHYDIAKFVGDDGRQTVAFRKQQTAAVQVSKGTAVVDGRFHLPVDESAVDGFFFPAQDAQADLGAGIIDRHGQKPAPAGHDAYYVAVLTGAFDPVDIAAEHPRVSAVDPLFLFGMQNHCRHGMSPSVCVTSSHAAGNRRRRRASRRYPARSGLGRSRWRSPCCTGTGRGRRRGKCEFPCPP